jgi:hypothetical protein
MKPSSRLIGLAWLVIGAITLYMAWRGTPIPCSLKFFALLQIAGAILLLLRQPLGWLILITMSAFTMVAGVLALLSVPFLPPDMLVNALRIGSLDPRWLAALMALLVFLFGRFCWLHLRHDSPTNWRTV